MVSWRKAIGYGVLIWIVAFVVAFAAFPLRESSRPLFESIMPVVLAGMTALLAHRYLRAVNADFTREAMCLGLVWLAINVAIDLPLMLSPSPMQMTPGEYLADIGLTYVLIPIVTTGMGMARAQAGN